MQAQVADQTGFAGAFSAISSLPRAQAREHSPSLIEVKGFGRPKEFSGKVEDFQQWSKKTEAFFAGVIKEPVTMMELFSRTCHGNGDKISWILNSCRLRRTWSAQSGDRAAADVHMTHVSYRLAANSRKNFLESWRKAAKTR